MMLYRTVACALCTVLWISNAEASSALQEASSQMLMTGQDIINRSLSNITLANRNPYPVTVYGLYIQSYDTNLNTSDCSQCFGSLSMGNQGTVVSPVFVQKSQNIPIGQNYLYNMIYNGLYAVKMNIGSTPCALPGCSWPGDNSDIRGWCITIGAMSLDSNYTYSFYTNGHDAPSSVVPYAMDAYSPSSVYNYNYNVIDTSSFATGTACLGLVTCDDKMLTCSVATPQSESIQPY